MSSGGDDLQENTPSPDVMWTIIRQHHGALQSHGKRVLVLEQFKWWTMGAAAILGAMCTMFSDNIKQFMGLKP